MEYLEVPVWFTFFVDGTKELPQPQGFRQLMLTVPHPKGLYPDYLNQSTPTNPQSAATQERLNQQPSCPGGNQIYMTLTFDLER